MATNKQEKTEMSNMPDITVDEASFLEDVLFRVTARARFIMKVDVCGIWIKDQADKLIPHACCGIRAKEANSIFSNENNNMLNSFMSAAGPVHIQDLAKRSSRALKKSVREEGLKSLLACPIDIRGKKKGFVAVCSRGRSRDFTDIDEMILSTMADEVVFCLRIESLKDRVKGDYLNTIKTIARILEANDEYTYGHSSKVMQHSVNICKVLGFENRKIYAIKNAALLHDIGKIGVDHIVLKKKGKLSTTEWMEIKKHPVISAEIMEEAGSLDDLMPIVKYHHARFGGGGYPDSRLRGEKIPLGARIIAVADAYDAMTSPRPYRNAPMEAKQALAELSKDPQNQFDPKIVKAFLEVAEKLPRTTSAASDYTDFSTMF